MPPPPAAEPDELAAFGSDSLAPSVAELLASSRPLSGSDLAHPSGLGSRTLKASGLAVAGRVLGVEASDSRELGGGDFLSNEGVVEEVEHLVGEGEALLSDWSEAGADEDAFRSGLSGAFGEARFLHCFKWEMNSRGSIFSLHSSHVINGMGMPDRPMSDAMPDEVEGGVERDSESTDDPVS